MKLKNVELFLSIINRLCYTYIALLRGKALKSALENDIVFCFLVFLGAASDLERATGLAKQMVMSFGMGESVSSYNLHIPSKN